MGPILRRRFKIYLSPEAYEVFREVCRRRGYRRVNRMIECFMLAAAYNPMLLELVKRMAEKYEPRIFHEPTEIEEKIERLRRQMKELQQLLGT